jgi:hypothetical protein
MTEYEAKMETEKHIYNVAKLLELMCENLKARMLYHDLSKLESPELETFRSYTEKLKGCTFGSDEYKQFLAEMKPALDHHYAENRHHPEHFVNGIDDMNIVDIIEMLCDWKASTLRHADGDLNRSIDVLAVRFKISDQLKTILKNSVSLFDEL